MQHIQDLRHEFKGGGSRLAKVGEQGFVPFYCSFKLLVSQKSGGGGHGVGSVITGEKLQKDGFGVTYLA